MYALVPRLSNHDPTVLYGQPSRLEEWAGALTRSLRTLTQLQREARLRHSLREAYAHLRHCSRKHTFAVAYAKLTHAYATADFLPFLPLSDVHPGIRGNGAEIVKICLRGAYALTHE